jgi:hypothetical protein
MQHYASSWCVAAMYVCQWRAEWEPPLSIDGPGGRGEDRQELPEGTDHQLHVKRSIQHPYISLCGLPLTPDKIRSCHALVTSNGNDP